MGNHRAQDSAPTSPPKAAGESRERAIDVPKPTQDQQSYLEEIKRVTGHYDPDVVVGGPRRFSK